MDNYYVVYGPNTVAQLISAYQEQGDPIPDYFKWGYYIVGCLHFLAGDDVMVYSGSRFDCEMYLASNPLIQRN